jgi:hypothetical protein
LDSLDINIKNDDIKDLNLYSCLYISPFKKHWVITQIQVESATLKDQLDHSITSIINIIIAILHSKYHVSSHQM